MLRLLSCFVLGAAKESSGKLVVGMSLQSSCCMFVRSRSWNDLPSNKAIAQQELNKQRTSTKTWSFKSGFCCEEQSSLAHNPIQLSPIIKLRKLERQEQENDEVETVVY